MSNANEAQHGGNHYSARHGADKRQHWDMCYLLCWDYFLCAATKYIDRLGRKDDDILELNKAKHYLEKRLELRENGVTVPHDEPQYPDSLDPPDNSQQEILDFLRWADQRKYTFLQSRFFILVHLRQLKEAILLLETEIEIQRKMVRDAPQCAPSPETAPLSDLFVQHEADLAAGYVAQDDPAARTLNRR